MRWTEIIALIAGTLLGGCAATAAPTERVEASSAAIRAAEEVGAPRVPQAALHLQLAREQSERAKTLIAKGEPEEANGLLMRAQVDAELAVALARENTTRVDAQHAMQQVKALEDSRQ